MKIHLRAGFSVLELLVVIAVIGVMGAAAVYALNVSRAKARDAVRVSDISVLRSGLSQYWLQKAAYPVSSGVELGKADQHADGLTTNGFVGQDGGGTVILPAVPLGPRPQEFYRYKGTVTGYSIRFITERDTVFGKAGTYYAHAGTVDGEDLEK